LTQKREEVTQMDYKKIATIVLLVAGIVLLALSLLADPIGIGSGSGFGRNQIVGVIVGVIAIVAGFFLTRRE
jgi:hypothetical protein